MNYLFGVIFLLLSIWQLVMTKRSFSSLKKNGNENTSPSSYWDYGLALLSG